ncbi:hypothetical protein WKI71_16420 [Streptomyces sp. MS1.AVA.1]|uniref:Uncharacterized protein n=1 Tax=Streptomyces machairae TaxID=3134109 RepID=A0ABU8UKK7_9ACTN
MRGGSSSAAWRTARRRRSRAARRSALAGTEEGRRAVGLRQPADQDEDELGHRRQPAQQQSGGEAEPALGESDHDGSG